MIYRGSMNFTVYSYILYYVPVGRTGMYSTILYKINIIQSFCSKYNTLNVT
jgi:hypothetical protein